MSDHIYSICSITRCHLGRVCGQFYGYAVCQNTLNNALLLIIHARRHLEYTVPVKDPHLKDIFTLDSVQRLATKIYNHLRQWINITYDDHLTSLGLATVESRRSYCCLYKMLNCLSFFLKSSLQTLLIHDRQRMYK